MTGRKFEVDSEIGVDEGSGDVKVVVVRSAVRNDKDENS